MKVFPQAKSQNLVDVAFAATMYWRICYGALQFYVGYRLLHLVGLPAVDAYQRLLHRELPDDPHDRIFEFIGHTLEHHGFSITFFLAAHFIFWGVIDIFLSYAMLRHKLWAFVSSLFFIGAFMVYEVYRYAHTHSTILFAFICMDAFFVFIIWKEYLKLKAAMVQQ